jgi:hypothetical protein
MPSINEPLERDISGYAVIGHELVSGENLYTDIWDHKPPGVYLAYASFEFLFGYSQFSIYLMGAIISSLTLIGIYCSVRRYSSSNYFAIGAAFLWLAMSIDIKLQANQPNVEVFINLFLAWILYIALKLRYQPLSIPDYFFIGVLLLAASFFKTIIAFIAVPLWFAIVFIEKRHYKATHQDLIKKTAAMTSTGVAGWVAIGCYFFLLGRFSDFYGAVFTFNQYYAGSILVNFIEGLKLPLFFPSYTEQYIPLYIVVVVGIALSIIKKHELPTTILLGAYIIGTFLAVSAPGFFFAHYYQLWIPVLIIGSIYGLSIVKQQLSTRQIKTFTAVSALIFAYPCVASLAMFNLEPNEWSVKKYGVTFVQSKSVADKISELLTEDEFMFEWGAETGLYYYSKKRPSTKIIFITHLGLKNSFSQALSQQMFNKLKHRPPDLFVVNIGYLPLDRQKRIRILGGSPVLDWFRENYDIYNQLFSEKHYIGGALKGSRLSSRLSTQLEE